MSDNKMYDILGKFNNLAPQLKTVTDEDLNQPVYENVEPKGDIMEAVKSLESKYATFKEAAKPDFLDVDKDGNKKEPFKKAVKDKKAKQVAEGQGPYELYNPKHPKFKANYDKFKAKNPDATLSDFIEAMKKREHSLNESQAVVVGGKEVDLNSLEFDDVHEWDAPDYSDAYVIAATFVDGTPLSEVELNELESKYRDEVHTAIHNSLHEGEEITDLDSYQFAEPDKDTAVKPANAKQAAADRRRRLQDIEDRKAEKDDWFSGNDKEPNVRIHRAKYQDEPEEVDEAMSATGGEITKKGNVTTHKAKKYGGEESEVDYWEKARDKLGNRRKPVDVGDDEDLDEAVRIQGSANYDGKMAPPKNQRERDEFAARAKSERAKNQRDYEGAPNRKGLKSVQNPDKPWGTSQDLKATNVEEVAPPGAKAERMVKHIKKGYSKDGNLSKKEKGIAYATAWKAKKAGQLEEGTEEYGVYANGDTDKKCEFKGSKEEAMKKAKELSSKIPSQEKEKYKAGYTTLNTGSYKAVKLKNVSEGTEFKDAGKIKNSAPNMKKAIPAMVKESRVMEETDYFYEKVGKALAEQNPYLDTAGNEFGDAVRKEMVAQGIPPNRARNILLMDEDFLSDVATSYGHYCSIDAHQPLPAEIDLGGVKELDEIAALAGLAYESKCSSCGCADCKCQPLDEAATRKDFRMVADLIKQIPDTNKRKELAHHHSDIFKQQNPRFKHDVFCKACGVDECDYNMSAQPTAIIVGEEEVDEGNEFTKARLDAIAAGSNTFQVGGKTYNVSGDTSNERRQVESVNEDININITANGEQDALNLIRKLSGIAEVPQVTGVAIPVEEEYCDACDSSPCHCDEAIEEERDIELANTPHEKVAPVNAVTTDAGGGLGGPKKQYPATANRGANPIEESLWASYEEMINDVKA